MDRVIENNDKTKLIDLFKEICQEYNIQFLLLDKDVDKGYYVDLLNGNVVISITKNWTSKIKMVSAFFHELGHIEASKDMHIWTKLELSQQREIQAWKYGLCLLEKHFDITSAITNDMIECLQTNFIESSTQDISVDE